ncbi:TetR/AcrR family transcriptional regulator [Paenibacillus sp. TRM 82003]|uniref:TetR/AcrR family transcriptional regulator n=1 Tax=Kineococcus sp. TRM81007 TaxID=2925831 RepID=UPI001F5A9772|nr:TetR/AcrR family transcriptional regulator [Kineococcus sp. TRM81007]MCI2238241.1 TetR/AcrR family transcriptional regulator [Kineococcus sp. TRM81007]MCI3924087.1 TetR/AcrR family transcriptional regulator [Paenibacillus sp. TRM 82003]
MVTAVSGDARAARPSEARERLLRTASALFYAEGVRAVGVDRVVAEAAVTRATFYRHFPGKQDLVVAYLQGVDAAVRRAAGDVPEEPAAAAGWLRRFSGRVSGELCGGGFRGCPFINAAAEHPDATGPVRRAVAAHRRWLVSTVTAVFERTGHPDPSAAAQRWLVLRDGAMVAGYLSDPAAAAAALRDGAEDLLAAGPEPQRTGAATAPGR